MIKGIREVKFVRNDFSKVTDYFLLEIDDKRNLLTFKDSRNFDGNDKLQKISISNERVMHFIDNLFRIIADWERKYVDISSLDGTEWQLLIKLSNEEEEYWGNNIFPNNFEALDRLMNEIIEAVVVDSR